LLCLRDTARNLDTGDPDLAVECALDYVERGFTAVKHQREVGTGYFDAVTQAIQQGQSSTTALTGSTEEEQFH
jgi:isocitrate lyase